MKLLIDCGHGGSVNGYPTTKGKRSPFIPPGIIEGDFNRAIASNVAGKIDAIVLNPGPYPITLKDRVTWINEIISGSDEKYFLLSIHANAAWNKREWHPANGARVFFYSKENQIFAHRLSESVSVMTDLYVRPPKHMNLYIIKKVKCPALLIECGFMTSLEDVKYMSSCEGVNEIGDSIVMWFNGLREVI